MKEHLQEKKRVMVLTQPLWNNYGCLLQAYALQITIKRLGFDVCTDRRERRFSSFAGNAKDDLKRFVAHFLLQRKSVKLFPYRFNSEIWQKVSVNTQNFVNERLSTVDFFDEKGRPREDINKRDVFVFGSDQIWRDSYGRVETYFGDFLEGKGVKKIAYAASFGLESWQFSPERTKHLFDLARSFAGIGVREEDMADLMRKNFGSVAAEEAENLEITHVADPTLLLTAEDYRLLVEDWNKECVQSGNRVEEMRLQKSGKGILAVYVLDWTNEKRRMMERICSYMNLQAVFLNPERRLGIETRRFEGEKSVFRSVESWLSLMQNADFVLTDSYHGTIFSLLFGRKFALVMNSGRGISRFRTLDDLFDLSPYTVSHEEDLKKLFAFSVRDEVSFQNSLTKIRNRSLDFLKQHLAE